MKKSKHFRKDVIIARVIAAILVIILIVIISFAVSLLTKPSGNDKDTQNTQNTQMENPDNQPGGSEETPDVSIEPETEGAQSTEESQTTEEEPVVESEADGQVYVKTTTQVKLRKEPNTNCATLDRIDGGTELLLLETLEGWYKVSHNGQEGYVSADYAQIVEAE